MKFIRQLCSCWRVTPVKQVITEEKQHHSLMWASSSTPALRTTAATLALANQESPLPLAGKHGKVLRGSKSLPAARATIWKPSLYAIMEDKVALPTAVVGAESGGKQSVASKRNGAGGRSISIADIRLNGNNHADLRRSYSFSTVQAFSPASSFLF